MGYLGNHTRASAPAIFVIARYLMSRDSAVAEEDLQRALQPRAMFPSATDSGGRGSVLGDSLAVGRDIGLFVSNGARRPGQAWGIDPERQDEIATCVDGESQLFRSLVLRCLSTRALAASNDPTDAPSDVALGLTWLIQRDPLTPMSQSWDKHTQEIIRSARMDSVIVTPEQWRAFVRWARSFGIAKPARITAQQSRLVVDPSPAIKELLTLFPSTSPADQWITRLRSIVPVFGDPMLTKRITSDSPDVPGSIAVALQKLELSGKLKLKAADDARNAIALRIGNQVTRISEIRVLEARK